MKASSARAISNASAKLRWWHKLGVTFRIFTESARGGNLYAKLNIPDGTADSLRDWLDPKGFNVKYVKNFGIVVEWRDK